MSDLTKEEKLAVYVLDHSVVVCKRGVSSEEIGVTVGDGFQPCCCLADLHDGEDFGLSS